MDVFVVASTTETATGATRDQILDFELKADEIDLSGMATGTLTFVESGPFTGSNQVRVVEAINGSSGVQISTDTDLAPEAEILVASVTGLTADDFAL
nr:hypothetical protein [Antarctobacter sp.]